MLVRLWREGSNLELLQRSMGFAALGLVTLAPLLIVAAEFAPFDTSFPDWVVDGMGLPAKTANPVRHLFASPHQIQSTTSVLSVLALAFFGLSFAAAVQRVHERIWGLPGAALRTGWWRQAVWLAALTGFLGAEVESRVLLRHGVLEAVERVALVGVSGLLFFWWGQHVLLSGRVAWRKLLPGAAVTILGLGGLRVFSWLVFDPMIVSNLESYGTLGIVVVVESWLTGVGFVFYAGALTGRRLQEQHG